MAFLLLSSPSQKDQSVIAGWPKYDKFIKFEIGLYDDKKVIRMSIVPVLYLEEDWCFQFYF